MVKKSINIYLKICSKLILLTYFSLLLPVMLLGQTKAVKEWEKVFGGQAIDVVSFVKPTNDGGYFLIGYSNSGISGDKSGPNQGKWDIWIIKINSKGNKIWDKTLGDLNFDSDHPYQFLSTADGGFLLYGNSQKTNDIINSETYKGLLDYKIVKIDASGNKVWEKVLGGTENDIIKSIQRTADGGFIIGGSSDSGATGDKSNGSKCSYDFWIVKLNESGFKEWDKTLGGTYDDILIDIFQTKDGGYIAGGYADTELNENIDCGSDFTQASKGILDYWVVKLDPKGYKQWDKVVGGNGTDELFTFQQTSDDGFILGGTSTSNVSGDKTEDHKAGAEMWIVKLNINGEKLWDRSLNCGYNSIFNSLMPTKDGGFIVSWSSQEKILAKVKIPEHRKHHPRSPFYKYIDQGFCISKLNSQGKKEWETKFDKHQGKLSYLNLIADGSIMVTGYLKKDSQDKKSTVPWFMALDAKGRMKKVDNPPLNQGKDFKPKIMLTTPDNGFLLGGGFYHSDSNIDFWVIKYGSNAKK